MLYNESYAPMLGGLEPRALGGAFKEVWADVWTAIEPFVKTALSGEGTFSENLRLIMDRNGFEEETFWTFSYSPVYDDHGEIAGILNVTIETTQIVVSKRSQATMQRELVHRVKNSLAVTSAIVNQSLRSAVSLEEARDTISRRIQALGDAQSLLATSAAETDIGSVVKEALRPHIDRVGRAVANGSPLRISSEQAVGLSMAVYELATNAIKYGALSSEAGTISVNWEIQDDGTFRFKWQEAGGPEVQPPARNGFGSKLTNRIVGTYFSGQGATEYHPEGVRYELVGRLDVDKQHD
ncbi:HWE histidine kinase domain-containing protein [Devosia sp. 2618]|uniref:HWE histidine kinase domain-containing protein n=1 Tax=Devosia sp. 2618 TaxID=3156454 RepID=UPI003396AE1E